jgi:putative ABC transport system permease protein
MSPRWTKVARDAQAFSGRLSMIVVALAVSLAAVVALLSATTVLTNEVPASYQSSRPAAAQLVMAEALTPLLLDRARAQHNIADAQASATLAARINLGGGEWLPLLFFVRPDLQDLHINRLHPETGAWPPPPGTLLIERSALALTRGAVGQTLQVQLPHAGRREITIAGTVHDPSVAPAWQEQTAYGYVSAETLAVWGESAPLEVLSITVKTGAADAQAIAATVHDLTTWLNDQGHAVQEVRIPAPQKHPHQAQMNAVLVMLLIFSLLALLLGGVLTATVISGLLAQQVRQLAIMKSLGALPQQIAGMVLALVAALGLVAVMLGLPLGLLVGQALIQATAELLNLRLQSTAPPLWLYLVALGLGLATPLVSAALPIAQAARRTVKDALVDHGVNRHALASSWLARSLARWPLPDAGLSLALRNTFRRRARLVLTLVLLASAGALFITSLNLRAAWLHSVQQSASERHFDIEMELQQATTTPRLLGLLRGLAGVREVEAWGATRAALQAHSDTAVTQRYADGNHGGFTLRAAPVPTTLIDHAMPQGRWLRAEDEGGVVINTLAQATAFKGVQIGDTLRLNVRGQVLRLRLLGVVRELISPAAAYVTPATFAQATGLVGSTNVLRIALQRRDAAEVPSQVQAIVQALEGQGIGVRRIITEARLAAAQSGHVYILVFALAGIAGAMAVVGLLGLASALSIAVSERQREIGVLRAIGAGNRVVMKSVLGEGLLVALMSLLLALLMAWPMSVAVGGVLARISTQVLALQLSWAGPALWLLLLLGGALAVGWWPARRASNVTVKQALAEV